MSGDPRAADWPVEKTTKLLTELSRDYIQSQRRPDLQMGREARTDLNFALIYGLNSHAHELVKRGMPLFETPSIGTVPIVRAIFEAGVTAQWLRWVPDSEVALMRRQHNLRQSLRSELRASGVDWAQDLSRTSEDDGPFHIPRSKQEPHWSFGSICDSLIGGDQLYIYYRMLCGPMHAGVEAADVWLSESDGKLQVRREPRSLALDAWPYFAILGLTWAGRAFDDVQKKAHRANLLNRIAGEAGLGSSRLMPKRA